ncbi:MAG: sigma-70 family RNA polymerase sigma factor [Phycisphaerales bacterium]|nr:sigma-70 family RNA polymerase sigma factor [Phycisphaerales bacterium]
MDRVNEQRLIASAKVGDADAVAALIRAHQESLYAFMLRMSGRPEMAEDVVQEAFVRVLKNLDRFDPRYRFSTWLFTIAKRLYVNWMQKFQPLAESDIVNGWSHSGASPEHDAVVLETKATARRAVAAGLSSLGETQREIVLLFHQQDWSISEISLYLSMPEGTIKSHLHRARRKMREVIEEARLYRDEAAEKETVAESPSPALSEAP